MTTTRLRHNRIELALHELRSGSGDHHPVLMLHGLGSATPSRAPAWTATWPGAVFGLDFTGHGASTVPRGGGYSAEILMADVDCALAHLGPTTVVGFGLGAYIALLSAGGRPDLVRGAVLADGPGLTGGATHPTSVMVLPPTTVDSSTLRSPDPWALVELALDLRPPDYATVFTRLALQSSDLDEPLTVACASTAPWLDAVRAEPGVAIAPDPAGALERYRSGSRS